MINYILSFHDYRLAILAGLAYIVAIMFAIIIHELAHGYIALKNGDMTAKAMGRLTFNPKAHFNLYGLAMFAIVGIGWANPVPINPNNFTNYKKGMLTTSLAGVTANFLIAFISAGFLSLFLWIYSTITAPSQFVYLLFFLLTQLCFISLLINISLIAFNILPIYPLDGFRVIETLTKPNNQFVIFMRQYGMLILLGIVLIGAIVPQLDILGMYIGAIRNLLIKLFQLIFGNLNLI